MRVFMEMSDLWLFPRLHYILNVYVDFMRNNAMPECIKKAETEQK